jgi:hypothetical protein
MNSFVAFASAVTASAKNIVKAVTDQKEVGAAIKQYAKDKADILGQIMVDNTKPVLEMGDMLKDAGKNLDKFNAAYDKVFEETLDKYAKASKTIVAEHKASQQKSGKEART